MKLQHPTVQGHSSAPASPFKPKRFVEPDKAEDVFVLRSCAQELCQMLLAKLPNDTQHVPSSAPDRIPSLFPIKSSMPCKYNEETISALTDKAVARVLAMVPVSTKHDHSSTPAPEPFS